MNYRGIKLALEYISVEIQTSEEIGTQHDELEYINSTQSCDTI